MVRRGHNNIVAVVNAGAGVDGAGAGAGKNGSRAAEAK